MTDETINQSGKEVPVQHTGKQVDFHATRQCGDIAEADLRFQLAKARLLDINYWDKVANLPSATFVLTDVHGGEAVKSRPDEGDRVRIDIPGPGPRQGDGYDWVQVEKVIESDSADGALCELILRPTTNPLNLGEDSAHFFTDMATSTLTVERKGNQVIVSYHGRNEVTNTDTESTLDNIRNTAVGLAAKMGFSNPQWQGLIDGILEIDDRNGTASEPITKN